MNAKMLTAAEQQAELDRFESLFGSCIVRDDEEALAREFCCRHRVDPDRPTDIDGMGTIVPLWQAWKSIAVREAKMAEGAQPNA